MQGCTFSIHSLNPIPDLPLNMGHFLSQGTKISLSVKWALVVEGEVGGTAELD